VFKESKAFIVLLLFHLLPW